MTTIKQEWDLALQDQANALKAFKDLCKARYEMHAKRMQCNAAYDTEWRVSMLPDCVDEYGASYEYWEAINATRRAAKGAINAETHYKQVMNAWLEASA